MRPKLIVTGTGRCGTVFMARLLTSLGLNCGHETIFDYMGWEAAEKRMSGEIPFITSLVSSAESDKWIDYKSMVADSSYMAAPYLSRTELRESKIIHVVRHPVRVINSFCNYMTYFVESYPSGMYSRVYEEFIHNSLPRYALKVAFNQYDRAALYYILWNEMIERNSNSTYWRHRIEDGNRPVLDHLGCTISGSEYQDTTTNTFEKPGKRFQLANIRDKEIQLRLIDMGKRYGYNMYLDNMIL